MLQVPQLTVNDVTHHRASKPGVCSNDEHVAPPTIQCDDVSLASLHDDAQQPHQETKITSTIGDVGTNITVNPLDDAAQQV